ncbi:MAG: sugar phosphate isomerase/epimerase [Ruminococcaceae bacterium]|nr:sugar phosphate isomerase/epimerase [Oscillospiraceae bacterium]
MLEVGLSTCGFLFTEENFQNLEKSGIKFIEISRGWTEYPNFDYQEIKRLCEKYSIVPWSFHLPFAGPKELDIASLNEEIRKQTVAWWSENIKNGSSLGVKIFVAHPSSEPISEEPETRKKQLDASKKSLKELAEFASKYDAVIAVEDLPRTCLGRNSEEMADLVSADDRLKVCLDTNHMLIDNNLNLIEKLGDKIVTLHVSDYDFTDEKHWLPGEGKVEWQEVYQALLKSGYNGPWLYEILLKTPRTIARKRDLVFKDFIDNANQIFQNKPFVLKD